MHKIFDHQCRQAITPVKLAPFLGIAKVHKLSEEGADVFHLIWCLPPAQTPFNKNGLPTFLSIVHTFFQKFAVKFNNTHPVSSQLRQVATKNTLETPAIMPSSKGKPTDPKLREKVIEGAKTHVFTCGVLKALANFSCRN
jgi:hypothetical protein